MKSRTSICIDIIHGERRSVQIVTQKRHGKELHLVKPKTQNSGRENVAYRYKQRDRIDDFQN